jgi:hypothetical protein
VTEGVFRADRLLELLSTHGVEFVVIGGFAAQIHGSSILTRDLDICYARAQSNLERLAAALRDADARLRGAPAALPFRLDARSLANGDAFTFDTRLGALDVLGTAPAIGGQRLDYEALSRTALSVELGGHRFMFASLDDLIAMKRAAGRPKDLAAVEDLGALRDEFDRRDW